MLYHSLESFREYISALIPALGLFCFVVYRVLLKKPLKRAFLLIKQKLPQVKSQILKFWCNGCGGDHRGQAGDVEHGTTYGGYNETHDQLQHRVEHPQLYTYK